MEKVIYIHFIVQMSSFCSMNCLLYFVLLHPILVSSDLTYSTVGLLKNRTQDKYFPKQINLFIPDLISWSN